MSIKELKKALIEEGISIPKGIKKPKLDKLYDYHLGTGIPAGYCITASMLPTPKGLIGQ